MKASLYALIFVIATFHAANAGTAPENIRNKSFVVSWTETHDQREGSGNEFRQTALGMQMTVYISSAGRPFSKLIIVGGRGDTASHGSVGSSGTSLGSGSRTVSVNASGMMIQSNFGGAARRIVVHAQGSGCTAEVNVAKLAGSSVVGFKRTDGRSFELRSLSAGSPSCSARDGNAFSL